MNRKCCANCMEPLNSSLFVCEILTEVKQNGTTISSSSSCGKVEWKSVKEVLWSIYKLDKIDKLPNPATAEADSTKDDVFVLCANCANVVTNLYQCHEELTRIRHDDSYLGQNMRKLDKILTKMQDTWSQMGCDNDSNIEDGSPKNNHNCGNYKDIVEVKEEFNLSVKNHDDSTATIPAPCPQSSSKCVPSHHFPQDNLEEEEESKNYLMEFDDDDDPILVELDSDDDELADPLSILPYCDDYENDGDGLEKSSSPKRSIRCPVCKIMYESPASLSSHLFLDHTLHQKDPKLCPIPFCQKVINQKKRMKKHISYHAGHRPFPCPAPGCRKTFVAPLNVRWHFQRIHKGQEFLDRGLLGGEGCLEDKNVESNSQSSSASSTTTIFKCPISNCSRSYSVPVDLSNHLFHVHTDKDSVTCPLCQLTLKSRGALKRHLTWHLKIQAMEQQGTVLTCFYCKKTFVSSVDFSQHRRRCPNTERGPRIQVTVTKPGSLEYRCEEPECHRKFESEGGLLRHVGHVHTKKYKCSDCGLLFLASQLSQHMSTHHRHQE